MKRIGDPPKALVRCLSKYHLPPMHQKLEPGIYEHECPDCGKITKVTIHDKNWL